MRLTYPRSFLGLLLIGPTVWTKVMGLGPAIFPYDFPTFIVLPGVLLISYVVSVTDRSASGERERGAFEAQEIRSETGLGAEGAVAH